MGLLEEMSLLKQRCPYCGQIYPPVFEQPFEHMIRKALEEKGFTNSRFERLGPFGARVLALHPAGSYWTIEAWVPEDEKREHLKKGEQISLDRRLMEILAENIQNFEPKTK